MPRFILGILFAVLFVLLASTKLDVQGLQYDELHQAQCAFSYISGLHNGHCGHLCADINSTLAIPLLNMSYSGAMKTAVYGLYLRFINPHFGVVSWRLLGILFVGLGILAFVTLTSESLKMKWLAVFLILLFTDITLLLATRHDWGPVALALALRLLFLGFWLSDETKMKPTAANTFVLGIITGISIFEKLSNSVLLPPFLFITAYRAYKRSPVNIAAGLAGLLIGLAPLIAVNIYSYHLIGAFVSLDFGVGPFRRPEVMAYAIDFLSLGSGAALMNWILGIEESSTIIPQCIELFLLSLMLALTAAIAFTQRRTLYGRISLMALTAYLAIGAGLYFLPAETWVHHWIIATPFQYIAIAYAFAAMSQMKPPLAWPVRSLTPAFTLTIVLLLCLRTAMMFPLEKALLDGRASLLWDPSRTRIAEFASRHRDTSFFLATDWGISYQLYCMSDGDPDLEDDIFWHYSYENLARDVGGKPVIYIVKPLPSTGRELKQIYEDMDHMPGWIEAPVEDEISSLRAVRVRKFVYRDYFFDKPRPSAVAPQIKNPK